MALIIRPARKSDVPAIVRLADEFNLAKASSRERKDRLRMLFNDNSYNLFVAVEPDTRKVVGFVDFWLEPDFIEGDYNVFVDYLFVTKEWRKSRVGSKLLKEVVQFCKRNEVSTLYLSMKMGRKRLDKFYSKHGFKRNSILIEKNIRS